MRSPNAGPSVPPLCVRPRNQILVVVNSGLADPADFLAQVVRLRTPGRPRVAVVSSLFRLLIETASVGVSSMHLAPTWRKLKCSSKSGERTLETTAHSGSAEVCCRRCHGAARSRGPASTWINPYTLPFHSYNTHTHAMSAVSSLDTLVLGDSGHH